MNISKFAAATCALACALNAVPSVAADATPYEINAIVSLTGAGAFIGNDAANGLHMVESVVNRDGGINGQPVKFTILDDQSSPQQAVQLANQIIAKKAPVIIGSSLVGACNAMAPLVQRNLAMYCLSASFDPQLDTGIFSYGITTENVIRVNFGYFRGRGMKRVAAILPTDATGQDAERSIRAALALPENAGIQLVDIERFNSADVSVAAQMSKIKAAMPDVLVAYVSGTPMGIVLQGAKQVGLDVPIVTSGANYNLKQMDQFASVLPDSGLYIAAVPGFVPSAVPDGPAKRAINAYLDARKRYCAQCGVQTIIGWDTGSIVIAALRAVGVTANGSQVAKYIAGLHGYNGACGEYDFRRNPHGLDGNTAVIVRYDRGRHDFMPMTRLTAH